MSSNYGQMPPSGPGGGYGGAPQETESKATIALVIAIVSFFVCAGIGHIVSLVLAGQAERSIAASGGRLGGEGQARAAKILSWIGIALAVLGLLITVLLIAAGVATFEMDTTTG